MLNTLKKSSIYIGLSVMLALAACTTPTATTPTASPNGTVSTETASIAGSVTKDGKAPGKNASVVLVVRESGKDTDSQIVRTKENGEFSFAKVDKGNYRVAFLLATELERKDPSYHTMYNPQDGYTSDYYSFVTTRNFDYDGDVKKTFQVPSYNVGWKSELAPFDKSFKAGDDIAFSWAKAEGAKSYNVLVQNSSFNKVFQSKDAPDNSFTWSGADNSSILKAGETYYFFVNVIFDTTSAPAGSPVLNNGGSALSKFSISK